MDAAPLDLQMRKRIYALIQEYPGLHLREAARQLETSIQLVEYHVAILRENGLVREERGEHYVRLFAVPSQGHAPTKQETVMLALLRQKLPLRIVLFLLDHEVPQRHGAICGGLDLGKSKLSFHLRKLEAAGLVEKAADGTFGLKARQRVLELLLAYKPTPEMRGNEFADLWLSLYGKKP